MRCNGNNHRPGCNCGWGGVFHGLGLGSSASYWARAESYTVPNSRCPRCAASVYFYKSPNGGSVYFDDLGPPWPKHPCMDAGSFVRPGRAGVRPVTPTWLVDGWHPMYCQSFGKLSGKSDIAVLLVGVGDGQKQLFAENPNADINPDSPMLWRRMGEEKGWYEISTLDLSNNGFKEVRFDAYSELNQLEKAIRAKRLGAAIAKFHQRMAALKSELLQTIQAKEFVEKIDALIHSYHQALLDDGDPDEIEKAASLALRTRLKREVLFQEKNRNSLELHTVFIEECRKIARDFSDSGVDLDDFLRQGRRRVISAGLSIEAGKASLRLAVEKFLADKLISEQRKRDKNLLEAFIGDLLANSDVFGERARFLFEKAMQGALNKDQYSVDLIKEKILGLALDYQEASAKQLALKLEKLRVDHENERVRALKNRIKLAVRTYPTLSENALVAAVERMTNLDSSIEEVQAATDEVARTFLLPIQAAVFKKPIVKRQPEKPIAFARNHRDSTNSLQTRRSMDPFNSAMADQLGWALASTKKVK